MKLLSVCSVIVVLGLSWAEFSAAEPPVDEASMSLVQQLDVQVMPVDLLGTALTVRVSNRGRKTADGMKVVCETGVVRALREEFEKPLQRVRPGESVRVVMDRVASKARCAVRPIA